MVPRIETDGALSGDGTIQSPINYQISHWVL
jgi:hypothetical protein